jgi:hypothetical protein
LHLADTVKELPPGLQFLFGGNVGFQQRQNFHGDRTAAGAGAPAEGFIEITGNVFDV